MIKFLLIPSGSHVDRRTYIHNQHVFVLKAKRIKILFHFYGGTERERHSALWFNIPSNIPQRINTRARAHRHKPPFWETLDVCLHKLPFSFPMTRFKHLGLRHNSRHNSWVDFIIKENEWLLKRLNKHGLRSRLRPAKYWVQIISIIFGRFLKISRGLTQGIFVYVDMHINK